MKNVWKRTMSLVLSGVLLLGSVPVQALAAEEIVEEVVEEIVLETEPKATQPQQTKPAAEEKAAVSAKNVKKVKGTGSNPLIDYPIAVNGVQVSSDKADNILGDADKTVSFVHSKDKKENKLTLNNAEVESVEWASHSDGCGPDLIIYLPEGTESTIGTFEPMEFEGAVPGNVRITGEGKLNIEDIEVSGNLVIENAVVNITGNAHLILAAEKEMEADTDNADNTGTLAGKGVYRTSDGGSFTLVTEETALPADGEYLEFVSDSHLGEDCFPMEDNAAHYRTCASDTCPLRDDVKIVQEHGSETEYVKTASTHQLVYSCCGAAKELAAEHTFAYVIAEDKTSMTQVCNLCGQTGEAIAVTAPVGTADGEVEWDGGAKEVTVNDSAAQITYYKADDLTNALAAAPDAPGSYVAVVMTNGQELRMAFKIRQKALTDTAITVVLSYDSAVYDGEPKELPGVTVRDGSTDLTEGTDYTVSYTGNDITVIEGKQAATNAGEITVTVDGKGNYTGKVSKTFEITKAELPDDAYVLVLPEKNPVYDGQKKTLECKLKDNANSAKGFGKATAEFYQTIDGAETKVDPINVGIYTVKIHVAESDNYNEKTLPGTEIFTIDKSDAFTDATDKNQMVGPGVGELTLPAFTSADGEEVVGSCTYTFTCKEQTNPVAKDDIAGEIQKMEDGDEATLNYTFTPAESSNYTGEKTGSIAIIKVSLTFTHNGETGTAEQLANKVKKQGTITYGDEKIVDVSLLAATANGVTGKTGEGFAVRYGENKTEEPAIGSNKFYVTYTGKLGELEFTDVEVCSADIYVNARIPDPAKVTKPVAKELQEPKGGYQSPQKLVTAGKDENIGKLDLEYSLDGENYSTEVPKASKPAAYKIWYRSPMNAYYTAPVEGFVISVIKPYLTAEAGKSLKDVVLPEGDKWSWKTNGKKLEDMMVGDPGVNSTYELDYDDGIVTWSDKVDIHVTAKKINVKIELNEADKYMRYNNGTAVKARVTVTNLDNNKALKENTDYTLTYTNETNRGYATVTVTPKGNTTFDAGEPLTYVIYDLKALTLVDNSTFPESGVTDKTGKDVKEALDEKLGTGCSETVRKYTYFAMKMSENEYSLKAEYWPEDGLGLAINYPTGASNMNGEYKVYGMYLSGEKAGEIIELTEAGTDHKINQYKKGASSISVKMDCYMALCIAEKEDVKAEYKVSTTASSYGKVQFRVGSSTTLKSSGNVKVGETITITATPNTNYAVTKVQYTYKDGSTTKLVTLTQNSSGKYTLKMPAKDITLRATFAKKTSSSKNPYSGDTSNIYLWITVLASSAAAIMALMVFWFKKRKK